MSTAAPAAPARRVSPWIEGPLADLLLYVWTPLLIAPLVLFAAGRTTPDAVYLVVASFGALGHHLPGMMRAYGDRALFQRFRTRFLVAPAFLVAACCAGSVVNRSALLLVVFFWGVWHGLMQSHGIARIYDAKVGSTDRLTARLDHLLIFAWFGAGIFASQTRWSYVLEVLYDAGGPVLAPSVVRGVQLAWSAFTAVVTVAFLGHLLLSWRRGRRQSPVKLLLHVTTISYWMALNTLVPNLLVSLVLFEIFHDVQYLSIVWRFNRGRVEKDPGVGSFSRFLFRPSWGLLGLYVGLVFAYGCGNLLHQLWLKETAIGTVFAGVLTASALLHFYYDGFIWKVREKSTRESLGLAGGDETAGRSRRLSPGAVHALKWALFLVPLVSLSCARLAPPAPRLDRLESIAAVAPGSRVAQYNLGVGLHEAGSLERARDVLARARALPPHGDRIDHGVDVELTWTLADLADRDLAAGRPDDARRSLQDAQALNPAMPDALAHEAEQAVARGDLAAAERRCRAAILLAPEHRAALYMLAQLLQLQGHAAEALVHARELVRLDPTDPRAAQLVASLGG